MRSTGAAGHAVSVFHVNLRRPVNAGVPPEGNGRRKGIPRSDTKSTKDGIRRLPFTGEFPLADDTANAELNLIFAARFDTISLDDKPVVTTTYRIGRLIGGFSFVTDQSCLNLFANEIGRVFTSNAR